MKKADLNFAFQHCQEQTSFPITCLDNFYSDPDGIRQFALNQRYKKTLGNFPGSRTADLSEINAQFFQLSINKLLSLFFQIDTVTAKDFQWKGKTSFQKIYPHHKDVNHIVNVGDVHSDEQHLQLAAVIYLNPNPLLRSGTSFYRYKEDCKGYYPKGDFQEIKTNCYKESDCEKWASILQEHNSNWEKTMEVKNLYNRLIAYQPQLFHGQTNFCMPKEGKSIYEMGGARLTQVFFIDIIKTKLLTPISRCGLYDI